jgi:hypothetical protein
VVIDDISLDHIAKRQLVLDYMKNLVQTVELERSMSDVTDKLSTRRYMHKYSMYIFCYSAYTHTLTYADQSCSTQHVSTCYTCALTSPSVYSKVVSTL